MTWSIRIYPLEYSELLKALEVYDVTGSEEDVEQAELAKGIVMDILDQGLLDDTLHGKGNLYECSLIGHSAAEVASLSINVYRTPAETQPQPAAEEAEAPPEEVAAEE